MPCDRNGLPSEIMTAINRIKEVMFMAFSFTLRDRLHLKKTKKKKNEEEKATY